MAEKHYKPEEIVARLRQVDVLISQGQNVADAIRQIGLSEVTYYRWRREFGGLNTEQVKRLKDLELENARLRKAVSDLTLDRLILQEVRAQLHVFKRRAGAASGSTARRKAKFRAAVVNEGRLTAERPKEQE
jgi:putative transposase